MVLKKSTVVFGTVILALLVVCVGLLVALLKNQSSLKLHDDKHVSGKSTTNHHSSSTGHHLTDPNTESSIASTVEPLPAGPWDKNRLPDHVIPEEYDLTLNPNLETGAFDGFVKIRVKVLKPTDSFIVHCYKKILAIDQAQVFNSETNQELKVKEKKFHEENEYYVTRMENTVKVGTYVLHYKFHGWLNGNIVGFYKSTYKNRQTNETRHLATSKFQPTFARRAFPCFDEPAYKAVFIVKLTHKKEYIALSNMPVARTKPLTGDMMETEFKASVPMVTYLVCFIVCDFKYEESKTKNNITFRVYATPDQVQNTKKALEFGVQILNYYEDYFGIPYPLEKQDMIAIPDFSSGAMEHWGLITYRETNLLYNEKESSPQNLQRIASVISHELAHMWFGNLVTMKWWDDLWLNEGFASYIEYKGVDIVKPKWQMMDQLLTEDIQPVIRIDATTSSHPIIQEVNNTNQITEIFDAISYNKGAAVLRMLESIVTPEMFKDGISNFLKKNNYSNAETKDLWSELNDVSDKNISEIMDTWTRQMGLPYVNVKRTGVDTFSVQQHRFLLNPEMKYRNDQSQYGYVWQVPLSYTTATGGKGLHWLNTASDEKIKIDNLTDINEWVKFNVDQTGYYIVNYETEQWEAFSKILIEDHERLSASDRSSLLFDAFQLAQNGEMLHYEVPLRMTTYLMNERHLTPWETAYGSLVQLGHLLQNTVGYKDYQNFVNQLTQPLYRTFGWKVQTDHTDSLLQTTIIGLACFSGNKDCRQQAVIMLKALKDNDNTEIPLALRNIVFKYAMEESGDQEMWEFMWKRYLNEGSAQEKIKLLYGLAHVQNTDLIQKLLDNAMNPKLVREQDFFTVLSYVAGNDKGRDVVWDFLQKHWLELVKRFGISDRYLGRSVKSICDYFNTQRKLEEMQDFFKKHPEAGAGERARQQTLENVKNNIRWLENNEKSVDDWLRKRSWSDYRLSDDVVPLSYDLRLHPELDSNDTFTGTVDILVEVREETDLFIVHIYNMMVQKTEAYLIEPKNVPLDIKSTFAHKANDFWVTELKKPVAKGSKVLLKYEFSGYLNNSLVGMYKSSYNASDGKHNLITSQFQSTYARRAFPCFDEPKFKSTFKVTLVHPKKFTALSNMPALSTTEVVPGNEDLVETTFQKSEKMVTYLVCVIISEFKSLSGTTKNGIPVRVFSRPDEVLKLEYALKVGVATLEYFIDYFKVDYPLPKLDMVAIPDFQAGAMENWGLVTYRETLLIFDDKETSPYNKLRIAAVIGHELAHMWFGNLVTMKWWNDLWLNEGFASYMEYKSMEKIEPTWDVNAQFYLEDIYRVLQPDASITSHPIVQDVNHPNEITAIFDAISYSKGASVLRMLEFFLTPEVFKKGVSKYLEMYKFSNAETNDLWSHLQTATTKENSINVTRIMDTWTRQMGYPYINVTKTGSETTGFTYELTQERFLLDPDVKPDNNSPYGYKWDIPLSYITENKKSITYWMNEKKSKLTLAAGSSQLLKFNAGHSGYYIVNYIDQWSELIEKLEVNHKIFSQSDRSNLISDAFLLARGGLLNYTTALDLTKYLKNERDFVPWETARKLMSYLLSVLENNKNVDGELKGYMDTLSSDALTEIGWGDIEDHLKRRLRETLVTIACSSENPQCLEKMVEFLNAWKRKEQTPTDLTLLIYKYGMKEIGDEDMWTYMWEQYIEESSSQKKRDLLYGLASTRNSTLLQKLLDLSTDKELVRTQDYFTLTAYIAGNPIGLPIVWKYFQDEWPQLVERFTLNDRYLGDAVKSICNHFSTDERLGEMESFFGKYPEAGAGERSRQEALTNVRNNIKWLKTYGKTVEEWVKEQPKELWHDVRLPEHILPTLYKLRLNPNIEEGTFVGSVEIKVTTSKATKHFLVHSHMLNIKNSEVNTTTKGLDIEKVFFYKRNEYFVIELKEEAKIGDYKLFFEFEGTLTGGLVGFYKSTYVDSITGQTRSLATSQFQSTYARRAFPCFDEPSIKSIFEVTLVHDKDMIALSNMPAKATQFSIGESGENIVETEFEPSVKMVTYLVCVIVCDFEYKSDKIIGAGGSETEIRVYAPSDRVNQTFFALKAAKDVLLFFENYFDIKYPLPKLDMIALPDFRAGAMENWGLITYREVYLIYDKNETSPNVEFSIMMIIAHEIAHMWFGNLVTMKWWQDLWLNEGFATFMAYKCVDNIRGDMRAIDLFLLGETADVLEPDATRSSHPIVQTVNNPDEISSIFDAISYSKGASVLRMLETFMEPKVFQAGIRKYLKKHQYGNAITEDLWSELTSEYKKGDISKIMDTWTKQMGYPVVNVSISSDGKTATMKQNRFLLNPGIPAKEPDISPYDYVWNIPIQVYDNQSTNMIWLESKQETVKLDSLSLPAANGKLFKWNFGQSGFFLINYDTATWLKWADELEKDIKIISETDRSNLFSDAFLLAKAGNLSYDVTLQLTKYLKKEDSFVAWTTAKSGLLTIAHLLRDENNPEQHLKMMSYLRSLTQDSYNRLKWNDDPDENYLTRRLRAAINDLACRAENQDCLTEASARLSNFLSKGESIPSALRSLVYRFGIWHDDSLWDELWKVYLKENTAQGRRDLLYGLAFTKDEKKLQNYIALAQNESYVRAQDFFSVVSNVANNPKGLDIAWKFLTENWEFLVNRYSLNDRSIGNTFLSVSSHFSSEKRLQEMQRFFADNPEAGAGKASRDEAIEIVQSSINWKLTNLPSVKAWLDKNELASPA